MDVGDLIERDGVRWMVASRNPLARTVKLTRGVLGESPEVADDDPEVKVIAHPSKDWPFIPAGAKPKHGPVKSIQITRAKKVYDLEFLIDWVPSSFQRAGGPIFFNPDVKLRTGEVLVAKHASGTLARMNVTKGFATVEGRVKRAEAVEEKKGPPTVYDHLLNQDEFDDD